MPIFSATLQQANATNLEDNFAEIELTNLDDKETYYLLAKNTHGQLSRYTVQKDEVEHVKFLIETTNNTQISLKKVLAAKKSLEDLQKVKTNLTGKEDELAELEVLETELYCFINDERQEILNQLQISIGLLSSKIAEYEDKLSILKHNSKSSSPEAHQLREKIKDLQQAKNNLVTQQKELIPFITEEQLKELAALQDAIKTLLNEIGNNHPQADNVFSDIVGSTQSNIKKYNLEREGKNDIILNIYDIRLQIERAYQLRSALLAIKKTSAPDIQPIQARQQTAIHTQISEFKETTAANATEALNYALQELEKNAQELDVSAHITLIPKSQFPEYLEQNPDQTIQYETSGWRTAMAVGAADAAWIGLYFIFLPILALVMGEAPEDAPIEEPVEGEGNAFPITKLATMVLCALSIPLLAEKTYVSFHTRELLNSPEGRELSDIERTKIAESIKKDGKQLKSKMVAAMLGWNFGYFLGTGIAQLMGISAFLDPTGTTLLATVLVSLIVGICAGLALAFQARKLDREQGIEKPWTAYVPLFCAGFLGGTGWCLISTFLPAATLITEIASPVCQVLANAAIGCASVFVATTAFFGIALAPKPVKDFFSNIWHKMSDRVPKSNVLPATAGANTPNSTTAGNSRVATLSMYLFKRVKTPPAANAPKTDSVEMKDTASIEPMSLKQAKNALSAPPQLAACNI